MSGTGFAVGDAVRLVPDGPVGRVTYAGSCGYVGCRFGDACVTVKWERYGTTTNHDAARLAPC